MTAQAGEELELDGEQVDSESEVDTDSQNDIDSEDDTDSERKKNSSNWKKMSEAKKAAEIELRKEREEKAQIKAELQKLQDWANSLYEDENQKPFTKKEEKKIDDQAERLEKKIFLIENKEAKEYLDDIDAVRAKYNMDFEDAWTFVKSKLPPESKSKKDFDLSNKTPKIQKDITKLSPEEALKLSKEEQAKWRKANGWQ